MMEIVKTVYWAICSIAAFLFFLSMAVDSYEETKTEDMLLGILLMLLSPGFGFVLAVGSVILFALSPAIGVGYGLVRLVSFLRK